VSASGLWLSSSSPQLLSCAPSSKPTTSSRVCVIESYLGSYQHLTACESSSAGQASSSSAGACGTFLAGGWSTFSSELERNHKHLQQHRPEATSAPGTPLLADGPRSHLSGGGKGSGTTCGGHSTLLPDRCHPVQCCVASVSVQQWTAQRFQRQQQLASLRVTPARHERSQDRLSLPPSQRHIDAHPKFCSRHLFFRMAWHPFFHPHPASVPTLIFDFLCPLYKYLVNIQSQLTSSLSKSETILSWPSACASSSRC
jgi:hypothetical protein